MTLRVSPTDFLKGQTPMTNDETTTSDQIESITSVSSSPAKSIERDPAESSDQWAVRLYDWMAGHGMVAPFLQEINVADLNILIDGKFVGPVATLTFVNSTTGSVTLIDGQGRTGALKLYAPPRPISPAQALHQLSTILRKDPEYAWTWHCNLACAGMDAGLGHQAANAMAGNFMKLAFGAEVDKYTPGTKSVEETCEGYVPQPDETSQGYTHITTKEQDAEYEAEHHATEDKMFLETVHALVKEQQSTKSVAETGKTISADETAQRGPVA
jgi:hypothetical protein